MSRLGRRFDVTPLAALVNILGSSSANMLTRLFEDLAAPFIGRGNHKDQRLGSSGVQHLSPKLLAGLGHRQPNS